MPYSRSLPPQAPHSISSRVSPRIRASLVIAVLHGSAPGRVQQKALEAFDELIAAREMQPSSFEIEQFLSSCGIFRLERAPPAVGRAFNAFPDVWLQLLKHGASYRLK